MNVQATLLPWDSEHFGFLIARWDQTHPTEAEAGAMLSWMEQNNVDCTYVLIEAGATESIRAVEQLGADFVDVRITMRHDLHDMSGDDGSIREAIPEDVGDLVAIAASSHRDGRFHADVHFEDATADQLYAQWVRNSLLDGFADIVLKSSDGDVADGYVICKRGSDDQAELSLIAVGPQARGRGIGRQLVEGALRWSRHAGAASMSVVTQGRNISAIRLYERAGFRVERVEFWYHVWRCTGDETHTDASTIA